MKHQLYFGIALRIVALFSVAMLATYLPDYLRAFFGDAPCIKCGEVDSSYSWGARHYWFAWMMFFLFILSTINVIVSVFNLVNKYYPPKQYN
jgi:hypothetical protein